MSTLTLNHQAYKTIVKQIVPRALANVTPRQCHHTTGLDSFRHSEAAHQSGFLAALMTSASTNLPCQESKQRWAEMSTNNALRLAGQLGGLAAEGSCYHCYGTGKCQADFKPGSGISSSGQPCGNCNGTGNCWFCGGTGKDQSGHWPTQTAA